MGLPRTIADRINAYNAQLKYPGQLPDGVRIMNPFRDNPDVLHVAASFYNAYYNDTNKRHLILGINPGRLGAGSTGIPFTDTKRLSEICGLDLEHVRTHEPSSVFVYEMIDAYGGPKDFYSRFYINSICPLGFTTTSKTGRQVNCNYYDDRSLQEAVLPFIKKSIEDHIDVGCYTDICYCIGSGKNFKFLDQLNKEEGFFDEIVPLDHPRFIVQYRNRHKDAYIEKYLNALGRVD